MSKGVFISFEGVEGSGKSTQLRLVADRLRADGFHVVATKEPGGTPLGDRVRAIFLDPDAGNVDPMTEAFLIAASRRQHIVHLIRPALAANRVVLCDRFVDATLAYQGFGRLIDLDRLRTLINWATEGTAPDVTLMFDISEEEGLYRARARNQQSLLMTESRLENEDLRFHRRVREGYLAMALAEPIRFAVIDADGSIQDVFQRVLSAIHARLPELIP